MFVYARISSKEQAEKELSISAQPKSHPKILPDKGWKLVAEYLGAGKSAKKLIVPFNNDDRNRKETKPPL